jgi:hypothetical protein
MVQWVAGLPESHRQALVRTFQSVFPDATLWSNRLLIGSKQPLQLSREAISRRLEDPEWREVLSLIGVKQPDDLLKLYVAGPRELASYAGEGWVLSDDRPFAEYFLSLTDRGNGNDLNRVRGNARRDLLRE